MTGSLSVGANATAYLRPNLELLLGGADTGIYADASVKFQLLAELQPPEIDLYAELVPELSAGVEVCGIQKPLASTSFQPYGVELLSSYPQSPTGTPAISVTPNLRAFGSVAVGSTEDLPFVVQNTRQRNPVRQRECGHSVHDCFRGDILSGGGSKPDCDGAVQPNGRTVVQPERHFHWRRRSLHGSHRSWNWNERSSQSDRDASLRQHDNAGNSPGLDIVRSNGEQL